ncbi:hypothetical protein C8039_15435 [Halogeometricum sp. wsp3]|nr:hypothetical protein C8039_15435 [Halogeometricum sp. wsp3]
MAHREPTTSMTTDDSHHDDASPDEDRRQSGGTWREPTPAPAANRAPDGGTRQKEPTRRRSTRGVPRPSRTTVNCSRSSVSRSSTRCCRTFRTPTT